MQEIKEFLNKLKLNSKEIEVYLVGLKNGAMHASDIAKETGLTRPNAYDVLKKLQEKGLCHQLSNAYGRKFKMSTGKELQNLIERQKKESEELENNFEKVLPLINNLQGKFYEPYPRIEFFEGKEGIKQILEKTLQNEEKIIYGAISVKNWIELLGKEFTKYYVDKRVKHGIVARTLRIRKGELKDLFYHQHEKQKRHMRYVPKDIKLDSSIILWDNKVALITTKKENIGILMHSKDYFNTLKTWFEFIWNKSR